jgi:hypothetical protein
MQILDKLYSLMMQTINNFNELIKYFNRPEIEFKHIQEICTSGLCVIFVNDHTKESAIKLLHEYWCKWGQLKERPIFIDVEFD